MKISGDSGEEKQSAKTKRACAKGAEGSRPSKTQKGRPEQDKNGGSDDEGSDQKSVEGFGVPGKDAVCEFPRDAQNEKASEGVLKAFAKSCIRGHEKQKDALKKASEWQECAQKTFQSGSRRGKTVKFCPSKEQLKEIT